MPSILSYLRSFRQLAPLSDNDGALLHRFRLQRDEQAFTALVQRHGPLVLGILRRLLGAGDLTDDVFQATFLVLARKGRRLEHWPSVAGWLVQVARRTALQARAKADRRIRHEQQAAAMTPSSNTADPAQPAEQRELAELLDSELARLPSKYRTPLILCQLQGQTKEETARQLGWPVGSVSGRLARGKKMLQENLIRRGLVPSIVAGAFSIPRLEAHVPSLLIQATTLLATNVVHQSSTVSTSAAVTLAQGVITSMFMNKVKYAAVALLSITFCLGTGAWAWSTKVAHGGDHAQEFSIQTQPVRLHDLMQGDWVSEKSNATNLVAREVGLLTGRKSDERMVKLSELKYWKFSGNQVYLSNTWFNVMPIESRLAHFIPYEILPFETLDPTTPSKITIADLRGVITVQSGKVHATFVSKTNPVEITKGNEDDPTTWTITLRRATDYDRLEGVWRKEERNPVTNELTEVDELIFRDNFFVRRKYTTAGGLPGAIGLSQEYSPEKFELHESLTPKGIDLNIRDENRFRKKQPMLFRDLSKLNQFLLAERNLGIYQLSHNEFKYVITGLVPHEVRGDHLFPNPKSPEAVRGMSFENTKQPIQVYKRYAKSLRDEMSEQRSVQQPPVNITGLDQKPSSPQLQSLRQQRLKLAQERMTIWQQDYYAGKVSLDELGSVSRQVLDASLAVTDDRSSKIQAFEDHLKVLKDILRAADAKYKAGSAHKRELIAAQLRVVECEIQLEELKAK